MTVKIDFVLSQYFGVVEQIIFKLVLNGITSTYEISDLLRIFSDQVIANSFMKLVNKQVMCADVNAGGIFPSEALVALIDVCINNTYDINLPDELVSDMLDGKLFITDTKTKDEMLKLLLPGVKLGFLANALDFCIYEKGENDE